MNFHECCFQVPDCLISIILCLQIIFLSNIFLSSVMIATAKYMSKKCHHCMDLMIYFVTVELNTTAPASTSTEDISNQTTMYTNQGDYD